ncbi:MAG: O-Antigen ligase [Microgenomates bacterium OLB22]|nr:MAG: O-Antigen ligase [Microgenomates bacterium OLB22]
MVFLRRACTVVLYTLLVLTPLIVFPRTSELFEFNKMLVVYGLAGVSISLLTTYWIVTKKIAIEKTLFTWSLLGLLVAFSLSALFSIDRHTSLYGYYGRFNGGLLSYTAFAVIHVALLTLLSLYEKKNEFIDKTIAVSVGVAAFVVLWGLPGTFGKDLSCWLFSAQKSLESLNNLCWTASFRPAERMFSTLGQPNWLGAYLAAHIFLWGYGWYRMITAKKAFSLYQQIFWWSSGAVIISGILLSRSRSALMAIIIVAVFSGGLLWLHYRASLMELFSKHKKSYLCLIGIFVCCVLLWKTGVASIDRLLRPDQSLFKNERVITQPASTETTPSSEIQGATESFVIRQIVWKGAWNLFLRYPILGSGLDTFGYGYFFTRPIEHNATSEWDYLYNRAHNEYLNLLATTGVVGVTAYGFVIVAYLLHVSSVLRSKKFSFDTRLRAGVLAASWGTILITQFFGFATSVSSVFFFLLPTLSYAAVHVSPRRGEVIGSTPRWLWVVPGSVTVLTGVFCLSYLLADMNYASATAHTSTGQSDIALQELKQALDIRYEHVYQDKYAYLLANMATGAAGSPDSKAKELASELFDESVTVHGASLKAAPMNLLYIRTGAKIYFLKAQALGDSEDLKMAEELVDKAASLAPTDPKNPYTKALFYGILMQTQKDQAKEYAKQAVDTVGKALQLKPDYRDALLLEGMALTVLGDTDGARKSYQTILDKVNPQDAEAAQHLEQLGNE